MSPVGSGSCGRTRAVTLQSRATGLFGPVLQTQFGQREWVRLATAYLLRIATFP
jgi:hypothetical protein